jgi:hypothetical protein
MVFFYIYIHVGYQVCTGRLEIVHYLERIILKTTVYSTVISFIDFYFHVSLRHFTKRELNS